MRRDLAIAGRIPPVVLKSSPELEEFRRMSDILSTAHSKAVQRALPTTHASPIAVNASNFEPHNEYDANTLPCVGM